MKNRGRQNVIIGATLVVALVACGVAWLGISGANPDSNTVPNADALDAAPADEQPAASPQIEPPIDEGVPGRWHRVAKPSGDDLTPEQLAAIEKLRSIGYVAGSRQAPQRMGVVLHDKSRVWPGINLYTSGHEPSAMLMDMDGRVLHEWGLPFEAVWPVNNVPEGTPGKDYWRRVRLFPNGDLLAIFEGLAMIKIDRDSQLIWKYPGFCHHDLDVDDDGRVYVLTRKFGVVERIHPTEPVIEDYLTVLSADGQELHAISLLRAFEISPYAHLLERMPQVGDLFHTNTVVILDGRLADKHPAFAAGNVLISVLNLDVIAVLDRKSETIVWATTGPWSRQHEPLPLSNGHLLLFDNLGNNGYSKAVEIDPVSLDIAWAYRGNATNGFFSASCGSVQRLPNGNTLITESDGGRAFSVTREGQVVWEFVSPHRAGDDNELIATLFDLFRLPPDFPIKWAAGTE